MSEEAEAPVQVPHTSCDYRFGDHYDRVCCLGGLCGSDAPVTTIPSCNSPMNYCEKVRTTQENSDLWGTIARSAAKLTALDPKLAMTIMASFSEDLATSNNSYERDAERLRVQYGSDIEAAEDAQKDALKEAYTFRLYDCQDELERATGEIFGRELDRIDEAITIAERQQKS